MLTLEGADRVRGDQVSTELVEVSYSLGAVRWLITERGQTWGYKGVHTLGVARCLQIFCYNLCYTICDTKWYDLHQPHNFLSGSLSALYWQNRIY